jgi:hypothetical protein
MNRATEEWMRAECPYDVTRDSTSTGRRKWPRRNRRRGLFPTSLRHAAFVKNIRHVIATIAFVGFLPRAERLFANQASLRNGQDSARSAERSFYRVAIFDLIHDSRMSRTDVEHLDNPT